MEGWFYGLALKPFIAVALFVLLFGGARVLAWVVYWLLPRGKLKTWLFRVDASGSDPPPPPILPARWRGRLPAPKGRDQV
jgi:hypothetical protein